MIAIAVTGTNGKTSCTSLIEHFFKSLSVPCGVIGTIDHHFGNRVWPTSLTTPDPITLQQRLKDFLDLGAEAFVMEASSHALHQGRVMQGFDVCLFTNLSRDHLDYHQTMDEYFLSKARLFGKGMVKNGKDGFAVINGDDARADDLIEQTDGREVFLFGKRSDCDFVFSIKQQSLAGMKIHLQGPQGLSFDISTRLIGEHNAYNLVGSLICLYPLGFDIRKAANSLQDFAGVPGRLQAVHSADQVYGFVDYAHTPDALEKVLQTLRKSLPSNQKIITVFGCGGDRDKGKRPQMGKVAEDLSDLVIVTSDNPRSEKPEKIIDDIMVGLNRPEAALRVVDRALAIQSAVSKAKPEDVILVAGKGHENYQIIGDKRFDFDDFQVLKKALAERMAP